MGKLLTFREAADRASNSPAWWRKLAARRRIEVVKLGRSARLREDDVERVIRGGVRPEHAEAQGMSGDRRRWLGATGPVPRDGRARASTLAGPSASVQDLGRDLEAEQ